MDAGLGIDLTIVPDAYGLPGRLLAYQRIEVGRDYSLYDRIRAAKPRVLGRGVDWYEDGGLRPRTTDPYGDELTFLTAGALVEVESGEFWRSKAAWAYLSELPPETVVLLWWH